MKTYCIQGGKKLEGKVIISGAKNAAASILPGTLLVSGICRLSNVPDIEDVKNTFQILKELGAKITPVGPSSFEIDSRSLSGHAVPSELGQKMRASHFFLGSLLARSGRAFSPLPGGCVLGERPIDQHLKGFEAMGAEVRIEDGGIRVSVPDGAKLTGADITFDMVTVGATMNLMLAAALAEGTTILRNAAKEPHVADLAGFLNAMGGNVQGAGTDTITIKGVPALSGGAYSLIPDQIEAGTYMAAAAAAGSSVQISNVKPEHLKSISDVLRKMGVKIEEGEDHVVVTAPARLLPTDVTTEPHPGFPTDMQPQLGALMCLADGCSTLTEEVWSDRFRYTQELCKMGADIEVTDRTASFKGVLHLKGADVSACDLRAGAALIIAALAAEGTTRIDHIHYIERGYERITEKLSAIGAEICMTDESGQVVS